ncbi:MAG TPA: hypothetical protein VLA79_20690 [Polyangia bacterium]|nr:hypothetical protein [Polyangia bacterium]
MTKGWMVWPLIVGGALQGGCLYWDMTARVPPHHVVARDQRATGALAVVLERPFVDVRPQPNRCGMKKVRHETASVFCEAPPNVWLADMLEDDLRAAGVDVYENAAPAGGDAVTIAVVLTQFFVEPEVWGEPAFPWYAQEHQPEADIGLRLTARNRAFVGDRRLYVKGLGVHTDGLDSNYQLAIDDAVDKALAAAVTAIVDLVAHPPSAPAEPCRERSPATPPG